MVPKKGMVLGNRLIFSCMRNEGPFLLEWLNFHRSIGFDSFLIFTNDCEDGSELMADRLAELGLITHIRNDDYQKRGPQWTALNSPPLRQALRQADWALHLDLDEFLNIKLGTGQLADLVAKIGGADAMSIPWRFFGNDRVFGFEDAPIVGQFTRCNPYPIMFPRQALMFKTLFRPSGKLDRAGVHAPRLAKDAVMDDLTWVTGNGTPVTQAFRPKNPVLHGPNFGNDLAQINHYALRSMASFLVKSARGLPNHGNVPVDASYWIRRNFNDCVDRSLADRTVPNALPQDAALSDLHHKACDWHRQKADEVMATEAGVELLSAIAVAGSTVVPDDATISSLYGALGAVFGGRSN